MTIDAAVLAAVVRRLDPALRLVAAQPLQGGISATVLKLSLSDGRDVVLRRHGAYDLAANPEVAAHEFRLLQVLRAAGLPVPEPLLLDEAGDLLPTPYLLQSFIAGDGVLPADPAAVLAEQVAAIHALPPTGLGFLSRRDDQVAELLAEPVEPLPVERIRQRLRARWPWPTPKQLMHGDLWLGNMIWDQGRLAGIIDWEDAALGDPLADLGHARIELLWSHGQAAAQHFTDRYTALTGADLGDLPLWDLIAVLDKVPRMGDWGLAPDALAAMQGQALAFAAAAEAALL